MSVLNITKDNFEELVKNHSGTVLLDFWAGWCGPCRMMAPAVDAIAEERTDVRVGKVNVDDEPELAQMFNVMSIPTFIVFRNGEVVSRTAGARPKSALEELL